MGRGTLWLALLAAVLTLVACGRSPEEAFEPTLAADDPVAAAVQQTVAAIAVAQTVAALTEDGQQPPPATAPPLADTPAAATSAAATTDPGQPAPTVDTAAPSPAATGQCTVVSGVNLRAGPGTVYDPPIAGLGPNAVLTPLAFSPVGFPLGQWLQVSVGSTGQIGWVSAGSQWVTCNIDLLTLPGPGSILPTPQPATPPPTATPPPVAGADIDFDDQAPAGNFPAGAVFYEIVDDPVFLFRMVIGVLSDGGHDGAGIESVEFQVNGNGTEYERTERTAGYCIFGGGEPTCNPWPTDEQGRLTWGEGGPVVETGDYNASIIVNANEEIGDFGNRWNWDFPFHVTVP